MGDRTYCTLTICGIIPSAQHAQKIYEAIKNCYPDISEQKVKEIFQSKGEIQQNYGFEEVNYGQIDDEIKDALVEAGLSFCWDWGMGGDYISGSLIYDARDGYLSEENTVDDLPFLTLSEFDNEVRKDIILDFVKRSREICKANLYIARSAHEQIEIQKNSKTNLLPPLNPES